MDFVAQLVRASVCGSEGRGFETHRGPQKLSKKAPKYRSFFYAFLENLNTDSFKKFPYPFIKTPSSFYVTFFSMFEHSILDESNKSKKMLPKKGAFYW